MVFFDNLSNKIKQAMSDFAEKFQEVMKGKEAKDALPPSAKEDSKSTVKSNEVNDEELSYSGNDSKKRDSLSSDIETLTSEKLPEGVAAKVPAPAIKEVNAVAGKAPDTSPVVNQTNTGKAR